MRNEKLNDKDTLRRRALKGTAMLGIAASALGLSGCGGGSQAEADPAPSPSDMITFVDGQEVSQSGSETTTPAPEASPSTSEAESSLQVEALDGRLPAQELAQATEDRLKSWWLSGADVESINNTYNAFIESGLGINDKESFIQDVVEKNAKVYQDTLFVDGWESNPLMTNLNKSQKDNNVDYLMANLSLSLKQAPKDALWTISSEAIPDSVEELDASSGQRVITYDLQIREGTLSGEEFQESSVFTERVTYQVDPSTGIARIIGYDQIGKRTAE